MSEMTRRGFHEKALKSLLTVSLVDVLYSYDVLADDTAPLTGRYVADLDRICRDVKNRKIRQVEWQKTIEKMLAQANLEEILRLVDFEKLTRKIKLRDKGELSLRFNFRDVDGIPSKLVFGKQVFALGKGRSVVPHGHNNMATAFLVLKGKTHGRHYDRVKDEDGYALIRPTIDKKFGPGGYSTVSDDKDNVHWFTATSERAFIFNFHVLGLNPGGKKKTGRVYLDPKGEKTKGGLIRAPVLGFKKAHELYG